MTDIDNVELLRRKNLIVVVFFFAIFNFLCQLIKLMVILDTLVGAPTCEITVYFILLIIVDTLFMIHDAYIFSSLYKSEYEIVLENLVSNVENQKEHLYTPEDYQSFTSFLQAICQNYSLNYSILTLAYASITTYGLFKLPSNNDCDSRSKIMALVFISLSILYIVFKTVNSCFWSKGSKKRIFIQVKVNNEELDDCCICLAALKDGVVRLKCNPKHAFHQKCIEEWLNHKGKCPLCKADN